MCCRIGISQLRVGRQIAAVDTHMCVAESSNDEVKWRWAFNNFGTPIAAVSTQTWLLHKKSIIGLHKGVKGWSTNCCCGHTHVCFWIDTCVVQNKSTEASIMLKALADRLFTHVCGAAWSYEDFKWRSGASNNFGRPIAAASTNTHLIAKEVSWRLHPRVEGWPTNCCCGHRHVCSHALHKNSTEGWPTNCCCEHTHVCCRMILWRS